MIYSFLIKKISVGAVKNKIMSNNDFKNHTFRNRQFELHNYKI